jgi:hypothetical protein
MILYLDHPDLRVATGRLFSRMMVAVILLTTLALITFGPRSSTQDVFGGRTPSTAVVPAE